jgi:hypothetical protein
VDCQVVEHQLAESSTAELGPHVHASDLTIVGADQLDPATPSWCTVVANHEEGHAIVINLCTLKP